MHFPSLLLLGVVSSVAFAAPAANADPAPNERAVGTNRKRSNFWFTGVNESGAEFGKSNIPGKLGTDYTWPLTSSVDVSFMSFVSSMSGL
jgi:endoglucanase